MELEHQVVLSEMYRILSSAGVAQQVINHQFGRSHELSQLRAQTLLCVCNREMTGWTNSASDFVHLSDSVHSLRMYVRCSPCTELSGMDELNRWGLGTRTPSITKRTISPGHYVLCTSFMSHTLCHQVLRGFHFS